MAKAKKRKTRRNVSRAIVHIKATFNNTTVTITDPNGDALMALLERRLDNVVTRLGFATSRAQARQMCTHGHILVNGKKLDIPSYLVRPGDIIKIKNREHSLKLASTNLEAEGMPPVPDWLDRATGDAPEGRVNRLPANQDISLPVTPQLIVELLSR